MEMVEQLTTAHGVVKCFIDKIIFLMTLNLSFCMFIS